MDAAQSLKIKRRIETRQLADKVIELFKVDEDNPAKEQDPCTLLAWLVLLRENYEGEVTTLESLEEAVAAGDYEAYGLMPSHRGFFREEAFEGYLNRVKQIAHTIEHCHPIPGFNITTGIGGYAGHVGVDFATGVIGYEIIATTSGMVESTAITQGGYGKSVKIKDYAENIHIYAHMSDNSIVSVGDYLLAGRLIGYSGNTGNSTGPHLHYEVQSKGSYGDNKQIYNEQLGTPGYLNPEDFMP